jgi:hypothetical protein
MGLFSLLMLTSCSSDDGTAEVPINNETGDKGSEAKEKGTKTPAGSYNNITGYITYNNDLEAWHFISYWPYCYGPAHDYYTINLGNEYKIDWLLVTLSGNIFIDKVEQRSYIEITKIERNYKWPTQDKDRFFPTDIEECYSGCVTDAKDDGDSIMTIITEQPDSIPFYGPRINTSVSFLKGDLQNPDIQEGDVIDFRITRYKMLSIRDMGDYYCDKFFCNVEPCK